MSYCRFFGNMSVSNIKISDKITSFSTSVEKINSMDSNSILFNNFDTTVNAYYFNSQLGNTVPVFVYRKKFGQQYWDYLGILEVGQGGFLDYNVANNQYYHYLASVQDNTGKYVVFENKYLDPATSEYSDIFIKTNWDFWSICSIAETQKENEYRVISDVWILNSNLESGDVTQNLSVTSWDTLGKYSKVSIGVKDFQSSTISCLLGNITSWGSNNYSEAIYTSEKYIFTKDRKFCLGQKHYSSDGGYNVPFVEKYSNQMEKMEAWKQFASDGRLKLLKDRKGQKWIIQMMDSSTKTKDETYTQMSTISFGWQEVLGTENISIINPYSL